MERSIPTTSNAYKPKFPQQNHNSSRPWRGRIHPNQWTGATNGEIFDNDLKDNENRLRLAFVAAGCRTKWVEIPISELARAISKSERWTKELKGRLISKDQLEEKRQYDANGNQRASLYRLRNQHRQPFKTKRVTTQGGVNDSSPQYFKDINTKPKPKESSLPSTKPEVVALAVELAGEFGVKDDTLISACREELTEKPVHEARVVLKSQWQRWLLIAHLFPGITTETFWRINRHELILKNLERDAVKKLARIAARKAEAERHRAAWRKRHEARIVRPRCPSVPETETLPQDVTEILNAYRKTPGTTGYIFGNDRDVAMKLSKRCIPFQTVENALALGAVRRLASSSGPLPKIKSLAYFLPVVEEVIKLNNADNFAPGFKLSGWSPDYNLPKRDAYFKYVKDKIARLRETHPELFNESGMN